MEYPWYEMVNGPSLQQGDLFDRCPILIPQVTLPESVEVLESVGREMHLDGEVQDFNVVVMSQSCDLVNDKLAHVMVCAHWSLEEIGQENDYLKSKRGKEALRQGNIPGYHLLAACEVQGMVSAVRVVDFRTAFSLPLEVLKSLAQKRGQRLRLLPPYREHMAQAFARFFMRVGLPVDIPPFL
ncbi:MAG: hypothetical protein HYZ50_02890 [Deltaproteobacteria bacterium]|nr:hypothetical protein [Deltaproteobacteria bacterium]